MASLADLILCDDLDLDDLEVDDKDVIRELEEVHALRAIVSPNSAAVNPLPVKKLPKPAKATLPASGYAKASLADKILATADDGVDDIDREFQAMERELQKQMLKYKEQCDAAPVLDAAGSATSRPSSKSSAMEQPATGTMDVTSADTVEPDVDDVAAPELLNLRAEAAQMEEVFPEVEAGKQDSPEKPMPVRHRRVMREGISREPVPEDREAAEMKDTLANLDARMDVISKKHALHDPLQYTPSSGLSTAASRAISELQSQNAHLRERFGPARNPRGLLNIDPCVFGEKPPKGVTASVAVTTSLQSTQQHLLSLEPESESMPCD